MKRIPTFHSFIQIYIFFSHEDLPHGDHNINSNVESHFFHLIASCCCQKHRLKSKTVLNVAHLWSDLIKILWASWQARRGHAINCRSERMRATLTANLLQFYSIIAPRRHWIHFQLNVQWNNYEFISQTHLLFCENR